MGKRDVIYDLRALQMRLTLSKRSGFVKVGYYHFPLAVKPLTSRVGCPQALYIKLHSLPP